MQSFVLQSSALNRGVACVVQHAYIHRMLSYSSVVSYTVLSSARRDKPPARLGNVAAGGGVVVVTGPNSNPITSTSFAVGLIYPSMRTLALHESIA